MNRVASFRRIRVLAAAALLVGSLGAAGAAPVSAYTAWYADLSGAAEVPGPGDPDAEGTAQLAIDPANGSVCVGWDIVDLASATAAHIHAGADGAAGPVVVDLALPEPDGTGGDCVNGLDEATLQAIVDDPTAYYVNVHNAAFPDGAVRGQLSEAVELTRVEVAKAVCPPEIQSPADLLAAPSDTCTPAVDTGSIDPPPAGHVYDPEPLIFDMDVTLVDDGGTLTLDDADLDGGGTCGPTVCTISRSYSWQDIVVGPTSLTEETFPDGYHFGWAILTSGTQGGSAPTATVDVDTATISFDTTGFEAESVMRVILYDFVDVAGPTPTPAPTSSAVPSTPGGAGSVSPTTFSPPPTDAALAAAREPAAIIPFLLVVGSCGFAAAALAGRRRPRRR